MRISPRRPGTGDLISTLCFAGVGLWLTGQGLQAEGPRALLLGLCAAACLLGAARHRIAAICRRRAR